MLDKHCKNAIGVLLTLIMAATPAAGYWETIDGGEEPMLSPDDPRPFHELTRFLSGDFDGDGTDELLAIFSPVPRVEGEWYMLQYGDAGWTLIDSGTSLGVCEECTPNYLDIFFVDDFDGDGADELLQIRDVTDWRVSNYSPSFGWGVIAFSNSGSMGEWGLGPGDRYRTGDFDGDGRSELLAIDDSTDRHATLRLDFSVFPTAWSVFEAGNDGLIHVWFTSEDDHYVTDDFDGDGVDELLAINPANGFHHTMEMQPVGGGLEWRFIEGNGSGLIHLWYLSTNDIYLSGDFTEEVIGAELLAINASNGWSHTMAFIGNIQFPRWRFLQGNGGGNLIGDFELDWGSMYTRRKTVGDFDGDGIDELLSLIADPFDGFWQLLEF